MKLRIYEVSVADAGVYVLEAANADMTTSESVTLAVTGKSKPHRLSLSDGKSSFFERHRTFPLFG